MKITLYKPIPCTKGEEGYELPKEGEYVTLIFRTEQRSVCTGFYDGEDFLEPTIEHGDAICKPTHWLKPITIEIPDESDMEKYFIAFWNEEISGKLSRIDCTKDGAFEIYKAALKITKKQLK